MEIGWRDCLVLIETLYDRIGERRIVDWMVVNPCMIEYEERNIFGMRMHIQVARTKVVREI